MPLAPCSVILPALLATDYPLRLGLRRVQTFLDHPILFGCLRKYSWNATYVLFPSCWPAGSGFLRFIPLDVTRPTPQDSD